MQNSQAQILSYCLKNCIFDGWSTKLLEDASISTGLDKNYWQIPFPNGVVDVIAFFSADADANLQKCKLANNLRTHEKVRELIKFRLNAEKQHREAIKLAISVLALHPIYNLKITYCTVDSIWRLAGDKSTDWNFYSKRALLAGVYGSTLLYWLHDDSEDFSATWKFLDKRLAETAAFGKNIGKLKNFFNNAKS